VNHTTGRTGFRDLFVMEKSTSKSALGRTDKPSHSCKLIGRFLINTASSDAFDSERNEPAVSGGADGFRRQ
jgi:hypothetical protein